MDDFTLRASEADVGAFFARVGKVAGELGLNAKGYRVVSNVGENALQQVGHFHVHVLGGERLGPIGTATPEADENQAALALVLHPREDEEEATPAQVEALAGALELSLYDARNVIDTALPRVLRRGPETQIRDLAKVLATTGLDLGVVEVDALLSDIEPWVVEWIELEDDKLFMVGADGKVALAFSKDALLVRGRYGHDPFVHLYLPGNPRPYAFVESELRDYIFLGEDKTASGHANFELLFEILSAPGPDVHTELLTHAVGIGAGVAPLFKGTRRPDTPCPDLDAELLSRMIYFGSEASAC
jgi:diadenosine tetraphosphate (Ap4A) HIT family hydrolase